jgi:hypothetical protein
VSQLKSASALKPAIMSRLRFEAAILIVPPPRWLRAWSSPAGDVRFGVADAVDLA